MEKRKIKKAFGRNFVLMQGNFVPMNTTWNNLAKEIKNPSGSFDNWGGKYTEFIKTSATKKI